MARYCFYCGRELKTGEKCGCRSHTRGSEDAGRTTASSKGQGQAGSAGKEHKAGGQSIWQRLNTFFFPVERHKASPQGAQEAYRASEQGNQPASVIPAGRRLLRQLLAYLTRPADSISEPDRQIAPAMTRLLLLLAGLLGGFFLVVSLGQTQLKPFISLNNITLSAGATAYSQSFLFFQGFGIGLVLVLLPPLLYHIVLRLTFRYTVSLPVLIIRLNPAYFFADLFLLGALLVLPGSVFSAFFLLAAGLAAGALAQYLVVRRLTNFDENRCLMLVVLVMLVYSGIAAFLLNLSLPVLHALLDQSLVI